MVSFVILRHTVTTLVTEFNKLKNLNLINQIQWILPENTFCYTQP